MAGFRSLKQILQSADVSDFSSPAVSRLIVLGQPEICGAIIIADFQLYNTRLSNLVYQNEWLLSCGRCALEMRVCCFQASERRGYPSQTRLRTMRLREPMTPLNAALVAEAKRLARTLDPAVEAA